MGCGGERQAGEGGRAPFKVVGQENVLETCLSAAAVSRVSEKEAFLDPLGSRSSPEWIAAISR